MITYLKYYILPNIYLILNMIEQPSEVSTIFKDHYGMKVWQLRHLAVSNFIQKNMIKSILDIGCSDGKLLQRLSRHDVIERLIGVDIDKQVLNQAKSNTFPQAIQSDIQYRRKQKLQLTIYQADATKHYQQLKNIKAQLVTLIEVIQHLKQEILPNLITCVFNYLLPEYVIITTPNQQFNIFFNLQSQFRHWDHKFQWTQQQFIHFCQKIQNQYGYSFQIFGVGEHLKDTSKGYCSQGAIFKKDLQFPRQQKQKTLIVQKGNLNKICHYTFPFWRQSFLSDLKYQIIHFVRRSQDNRLKIRVLVKNIKATIIGKCLIANEINVNEDYLQEIIKQMPNFTILNRIVKFHCQQRSDESEGDHQCWENQQKLDQTINQHQSLDY